MGMLISLFGSLLIFALVISGMLLMGAPASGKQLLKNTAAGSGLCLLGIVILQVCCATLNR